MADIPTTKRALVAPRFCGPRDFEIADRPLPAMTRPGHVLIRVHACALMAGDCVRARGTPIIRLKVDFPMELGGEGAGIIVAIGSGGQEFQEERMLLLKPTNFELEDAASLPGRFSGLGGIAIQMAKNVFGAGKIISTVSTGKMPLVEKFLPGLVDQLVDYQTEDVSKVVPQHSVDFMFNPQMTTLNAGIPLLHPQTGVLVSLAGIPTSKLAKLMLGPKMVPFWLGWIFDLGQCWYSFLLRGTKIQYEFVSGDPGDREALEKTGEMIAMGKIRAIIRTVNLSDAEGVRAECEKVAAIKGGFGRLVVRVVE
ncbi:Zbd1p [Verticillium alfalfae VaMs.102]|uniref:Zbd1p n=1 Tax=Verticillium alfalfae (strain VaMs.102 / ATCC MYA-4576 / FGSC 10136) TaxID=526221 RepID=C9SQG5_VERA1|nr:Zbd1p [Verticillium alfalfae VaMs.102]EEY21090.1 Zbd1p [Verticillium alfalfae VaMs.102]